MLKHVSGEMKHLPFRVSIEATTKITSSKKVHCNRLVAIIVKSYDITLTGRNDRTLYPLKLK